MELPSRGPLRLGRCVLKRCHLVLVRQQTQAQHPPKPSLGCEAVPRGLRAGGGQRGRSRSRAAPPGHRHPAFPRPPSPDRAAHPAGEAAGEAGTSLSVGSPSELTGSCKGRNPNRNQKTAHVVRGTSLFAVTLPFVTCMPQILDKSALCILAGTF